MSWKNPRIPCKGIKRQSELLDRPEQLKTMVSEVFLAVFRVRFDVCYDVSNESCLRWWINENIWDFIAPTFIRSDPLQACTVQCEGHRPKVLLWIMEEFFYISHDLTEQDCDGRVVLSYELMMEAEHWLRIKQGGGVGCCHPSSSSGSAPPCSQEMLEHVAWSKPDSKTLEHLVWSVYDGLLSPGPTPKLTSPKSYNQVTRRLAAKVFGGLLVCCPARTSAQFDEPPINVWSVVFVPPPSEIARKTEAMDTTSQKVESAEEGAVGGEVGIDPDRYPMAWMCNCQHCYDDEMINFWPLLRLLTDGRGTATRHLVRHLLSMWQWSSVTHPMSCPPAPTNKEIGQWLPLDREDWEGSREDLWIEAYACCLQCMAEASAGRSWIMEGEGMAPQVSPLAQAFLSATRRHVSPSILWECWAPKHDIVPRQPMNEVRAHITQHLDEVATWSPSNIAWDIFAWPDSNKTYWKEDCLPYSPGSMVDLSSRMPGIRLVLPDEAGKYQGVVWVLKFEGHMLVYDPQTNGAGWVVMRGFPSSLTEVESWSASDLGNFYPSLSTVPAGPKATQSPPRGDNSGVWTDGDPITKMHGGRLR